ncbi:PP2C family protein-serine/threonine phosphatase [Alkaliphilus peptidifermentans]|uniref:Protein phosphatase n=1 Tax=Alkaliphilus peptidifermentans DSM 18978 TaxID=1120976 RepID=A0A1G5J7K3_9FIRM|nr:protein phosphatase 2C domain-containing protein [Alkaliphilus peptidifermentans]SCY84346.1 protein phosphatase [Alkaliphilus peptidifermentans DSM 18978]
MRKRKFLVTACSQQGYVKKTNQDQILIKIGEDITGEMGLFIVADGMGGLSKGELASQMAIEIFKDWWAQRLTILLKNYCQTMVCNELLDIFSVINRRINEYARKVNIQMGTTLSALFIYQDDFIITHIGDSRLYQITDGSLSQLTQDHSWVAEQVELGRISEKEAKVHSKRNLLTQSMGVNKEVRPYQKKGKLKTNGIILVCSDGFYKDLDDNEMEFVFREHKNNIDAIISEVIEIILSRGATDNFSAIIVSYFYA